MLPFATSCALNRNWSLLPIFMMAFLAMFAFTPNDVRASDSVTSKFRIGMDIGAGNIRHTGTVPDTDSTFYLIFHGSYSLSERLWLSAELGGLLLESGDLWNPSKGAGISQAFIVAQYYLLPMRSGWYMKGGGGVVNYWDNRPDGLEDNGWGGMVALGYDWHTIKLGTLGPQIVYGSGQADDLGHKALAAALSWSFP